MAIEDTLIDRSENSADVLLADRRLLSFKGHFIASRCTPSSQIAEIAGCALEKTPMGIQIRTNAEGQTSVPGILHAEILQWLRTRYRSQLATVPWPGGPGASFAFVARRYAQAVRPWPWSSQFHKDVDSVRPRVIAGPQGKTALVLTAIRSLNEPCSITCQS